jgi:DNA adenine methylase
MLHITYVEPFVGMGCIFLLRPFKAHAEVINAISGDVTTLFEPCGVTLCR